MLRAPSGDLFHYVERIVARVVGEGRKHVSEMGKDVSSIFRTELPEDVARVRAWVEAGWEKTHKGVEKTDVAVLAAVHTHPTMIRTVYANKGKVGELGKQLDNWKVRLLCLNTTPNILNP